MDGDAILAQHGVHLTTTPPKDYPPRWEECEDLEVRDDAGHLLYAGPRYLRCARIECRGLVTHGMVKQGACWCGNRKVGVALRLTSEEKLRLKAGWYPLATWEIEAIEPKLPGTNGLQKSLGWGKEEWEKQYG